MHNLLFFLAYRNTRGTDKLNIVYFAGHRLRWLLSTTLNFIHRDDNSVRTASVGPISMQSTYVSMLDVCGPQKRLNFVPRLALYIVTTAGKDKSGPRATNLIIPEFLRCRIHDISLKKVCNVF